jgi:hypothetical protein
VRSGSRRIALGPEPSIGEDHQHHRGGEEIDPGEARGIVEALRLDEENGERQHQHVVHGPFAEPFERAQPAALARQFHGGKRGNEQEVKQLQDRQHDRENEDGAAEERLPVADQNEHGGEEGMLGRPEHIFGEPDDRQRDAEREADSRPDDGEAQQKPPSAEMHAHARPQPMIRWSRIRP